LKRLENARLLGGSRDLLALEPDLERAAKRAGLTPDAYVLATLREPMPKNLGEGQLPKREAELLLAVSQSHPSDNV
jgi:hypothetical protein